MSKGFSDEKKLWAWLKPQLVGKWARYELLFPAGHPDVKGSCRHRIRYIELKVGSAKLEKLEPSQVEYITWLLQCDQEVWLCFGSKSEKKARWFRLSIATCELRMIEFQPEFLR